MENLKNKWLRPQDIEEQLGWSRSRQARLRCDGKLSYHKFGSFVYYDTEYIHKLIEDGRVC